MAPRNTLTFLLLARFSYSGSFASNQASSCCCVKSFPHVCSFCSRTFARFADIYEGYRSRGFGSNSLSSCTRNKKPC